MHRQRWGTCVLMCAWPAPQIHVLPLACPGERAQRCAALQRCETLSSLVLWTVIVILSASLTQQIWSKGMRALCTRAELAQAVGAPTGLMLLEHANLETALCGMRCGFADSLAQFQFGQYRNRGWGRLQQAVQDGPPCQAGAAACYTAGTRCVRGDCRHAPWPAAGGSAGLQHLSMHGWALLVARRLLGALGAAPSLCCVMDWQSRLRQVGYPCRQPDKHAAACRANHAGPA